MEIIKFSVDMVPVGKARARVTRAGPTYTPKETVEAQENIAWSFRKAAPAHEVHDGPVSLFISAQFPPPKRITGTKWRREVFKTARIVPHVVKPDADNILKLVMDALEAIAYTKDSLVYHPDVIKSYSKIPKLEVELVFTDDPMTR